MGKFLKTLSLKISPTGKGNSSSSPRGTKSPIQDKLKEKHTKTLNKLTKTKHKERILKATRKKQVTYKGNPICLTVDLSVETLQARREWQDIFKVLKGKCLPPRLLYPARISFKIDGEIKRQAKVKRIQYHQTSFTTNVKGIYIVKKYNRRKNLQNQHRTIRKWQ